MFMYVQWVGTFGLTMYSSGGNTEMIQMSCFSNMKIYTRFVVASISFSLPLLFAFTSDKYSCFDKGCPKKCKSVRNNVER